MVMPLCKTFLKIQCLDESEGFDLIWERKGYQQKSLFQGRLIQGKAKDSVAYKVNNGWPQRAVGPAEEMIKLLWKMSN